MSELAEAVEAKPEVIVTEGVTYAEFLLCRYSNFQLVICTRVCNDFPVVLAVHKRPV